jgi:hypothetical protein
MSGPPVEEPVRLSTQLLAYYREMVTTHSDDPVAGVCVVCHVPRCEDWQFARERLLCAGMSPTGTEPAAERAPSPLDGTA